MATLELTRKNGADREQTDKKVSNACFSSWQGKTRKMPQIYATFAVTLGAFAVGTALAWTSPALPLLKDPQTSRIPVTSEEGSWIGSLLTIGAALGGPRSGVLVEKFGRKNTMIYLAATFAIGWLLIIFAELGKSVIMIYIGRITTGLYAGAICVAAPTYISETVETNIRGALGTCFQVMITVGSLFVYFLGYFIHSWVWLATINATVPLVTCIALISLPESPAYLISKGQTDEAKTALLWLRGKEARIEEEFNDIQRNIMETKLHSFRISDLLVPSTMKPMMISLGLMFFQQISGVNAVVFYTVGIFNAAQISMDEHLATVLTGLVMSLATISSALLVDRAGRRALLLVSGIFMTLSLVIIGVYFHIRVSQQNHDLAEKIDWLPLASLMLYITAFSIGYGPLPWLMMAELFPPHVKGFASSVSTAFNWAMAFVITKTYFNMQQSLGYAGTYWFYAAACVLGCVFVFKYVPETKGKTFEEIRLQFEGIDINSTVDTEHKYSKN